MLLESQKKILELVEKGYSQKEIAKFLDITINACRKRIFRINNKLKLKNPELKSDNNNTTTFEKEFSDEKCIINSNSSNLRTLEDVIEYAEIDMTKWEVVNVKMGSWEMPRKNKTVDLKWENGSCNGSVKDNGDFHIGKMWKISVTLKKIVKNRLEDVLNSLKDDLYNCSNVPKTPEIILNNKKDKNLLEISLVDHHFGKLCLNGKGIEDSKNTFLNAIQNLLNKAKSFTIDEILLPIGNDFFHIDNIERMTSKGTPQDVDGHFFDIYKDGCKSLIDSVQMLSSIAPVHVLWVPGNHDFSTSFFLCEYLKAWFHQNKNVYINTDKETRKYFKYGVSLLGFTHGHDEKQETLARLIMAENLYRNDINEVKYFEYHIGHKHTKKTTNYIAGELGNVRIIGLPSLAGTDYWHFKKGFIGGKRAAEAYVYNYDHGNVANFSCNVDEI